MSLISAPTAGAAVILANITTNITVNESKSGNATLYNVTPGIVALLAVLYGTISLLAILGNGAVMWVILRNRKMQTVTNMFIANMALADVLIAMISIPFQFQAALLQRWILAHFMCPLIPFVQIVTVTVSILTLTVISIDRYFAVLHPLKPRVSKTTAKVVIILIWIFALVSGTPWAAFSKVIYITDDAKPGFKKPFCDFRFSDSVSHLQKVYSVYMTSVQYFVPLSVITCAYARIGWRIWGSKAPGSAVDQRDQIINQNKRKVIKMLIIVVVLFAVCWCPLQMYNLLSEFYTGINEFTYINVIWFCSNWLAMSNSSYNPFIYGLLNEKYKRAFCAILCVQRPCGSSEKEVGDSDESRKSTSSEMAANRIVIGTNSSRFKRYQRVQYVDDDSSFM
ncbi:neuromedin-K receptor-like isoform X2 [Tubulanus polymorphus]|uniref:neuromedin-K receptor-like isoform X2 n=1 Tax=Tubulanus polymorphus TaxID=672921 RepID=UPI003DA434E1